MFPSILVHLENGPNEFYFYSTNLSGNIINLAAVEKIKRKNIIGIQNCTGMSWREIQNKMKKKKFFYFFFQFSKNWVGRVGKTKNKKLWPKTVLINCPAILLTVFFVPLLQVAYRAASSLSDIVVETHRRKHLAYLMADQGAIVNPESAKNLPKQVQMYCLVWSRKTN